MANKYWVASSSQNWNDASYWSLTSGGTGGVTPPGNTDNAIFDSNGVGDCTLNVSINVLGLLMSSGYTGTIDTSTNDHTIIGTLSINDGQLKCNASTITCQGDIFIEDSLGLLDAGTSKFYLDGTLNISNKHLGNAFYDVELSSSAIVTLTEDHYIEHQFITNDGSEVKDDGSERQIWFVQNSDIVNDDGCTWTNSSPGNIVLHFAQAFDHDISGGNYGTTKIFIDLAAPPDSTVTQTGDVICGELSVSSGASPTYDVNGYDLICTSITMVDRPDGLTFFDAGEGEITVSGNVTIGDNATIDFESATMNVNGDVLIDSGSTVELSSATLNISGDFTIDSSATWNLGTGNIILDGTSLQTVTLNGKQVYNITVTNKSAQGVFFADGIDVANDLIANADTGNILLTFDKDNTHSINEFVLSGSLSYLVQLRSELDGTQWSVLSNITKNVSRADVKDSNLSVATIVVSLGVDSGNNSSNWVFQTTPVPPFSGSFAALKSIQTVLTNKNRYSYMIPSGTIVSKVDIFDKNKISYRQNIPVELYFNYSGHWWAYESGMTDRYGSIIFTHSTASVPYITNCLGIAKATIDGEEYISNLMRYNFVS